MISGSKAVVGVFTYLDDTVEAIKAVKDARFDYRVYSPVPNHEIEDLVTPGKSPVRFFTLTGGITGLIGGFALAILCSLDYPLRVSAKDVVSIPGFVVIGYECTILLGAIATLIAVFHFCRLPNIFRGLGFDPRFSGDKFGVVVGCPPNEVDRVKDTLLKAGAEEVQIREAI